MLIDLNGKPIDYIEESHDLKEQAEKRLIKMIMNIEDEVREIGELHKKFPNLATALSIPISDFLARTSALKKIITTGILETEFLGMSQTEDYSDMRKDLLKEMMFFIEKNKGDSDEPI